MTMLRSILQNIGSLSDMEVVIHLLKWLDMQYGPKGIERHVSTSAWKGRLYLWLIVCSQLARASVCSRVSHARQFLPLMPSEALL